MSDTDSATPPTDAVAGTSTDAPAGTAATSPATDGKAFSQEELNRFLAKERKQWEATTKAKQEEELKIKQGEWESLATQRKAELDKALADLQDRDAKLQTFAEEMEKQAKARLKALPDEIKAMAPEGDVLALYTWLAKAEAAAGKLAPKTPTGTLPGPRGNGSAPMLLPADAIAQKRASGGYDL